MQLFRFLDPFFHALNDGKIIRSVVSVTLRVFAVIAILGGIFSGGVIAYTAFSARDAGTVLGSLLFGALLLISGFLQCGILLYRAGTITELGDGPFTVTSIASVFCRLIGEELFVFFLLLGVGGFFYEALANSDPLGRLGIGSVVPNASTGGGLVGGGILLVVMAAIAFLSIVIFYALAELTVVLVDIARNMNLVRLALAPPQPAMAMAAAASATYPPPPPAVRMPATGNCPKCGSALEPGTAFCGVCGAATQGWAQG